MRQVGWIAMVALVSGLMLASPPTVRAQQQPQRAESTGSVSGRVLCGDTNDPARSARVHLESVRVTEAVGKSGKGPSATGSVDGVTVQTDLNGEFRFAKVAPGDYFVIGEMAGYLSTRSMFTEKDMGDPSPEMQHLIARALNRIHVEAAHEERMQMRMERGAAVSGTIRFDDGSPANDVRVKLLRKDAGGKWESTVVLGSPYGGTQTGDRGGFRIAGLPPNAYLLEADLSLTDEKRTVTKSGPDGQMMEFAMATTRFTLPFYGNGVTRQSEATAFSLGPGQEREGEDLTIPLAKLHRITGMVVAKRDGHKVSAAKVVLLYRDDKKEVASAQVDHSDGMFRFEFVPEGDFVIRTEDARDAIWDTVPNAPGMLPATIEKERVQTTFGTAEQPLLLRSEMTEVVLVVPDRPAETKNKVTTGMTEP